MLYGMDDEEKENFEEFVEEKHINIIKVLLAILIGIAVVVFFAVLIIISFNLTTKKVSITVEKPEEISDNTVQELPVIEENNNTIQNNVEEELEEIQIAAHDVKKLTLPPLPVENANGAQEIKDIYASDEKQVYLTFDDGPSKDITPQILDILKQYNVKATFFVLGARVELYPETLKREFEEGHYIANHGYSHAYSKIYENKDTTFQEYVQTEQCIKDALGIQEYNSYLFRFPGGSSGGRYSKVKSEARELFSSYGVAFTNWNCLTGDAENKTTADACFDEMISTKGTQNSVILLMHDANDKEQTVAALPRIIEYYINEGYTFKNFYEIFKEK